MAAAKGNPCYQPAGHNGNSRTHNEDEGGTVGVRSTPDSMDIYDTNQQVWVLQGETLVTVPRTDNVKPVTILFMTCDHKDSLDTSKGNAIYMGIEGTEMCLFCENTEGEPRLQLKAQKLQELYHNPEPVKPFLFYHSQDGRTSTFESVEFPDYFIASSEKDQPVFLTNKIGENNISFYFASKE